MSTLVRVGVNLIVCLVLGVLAADRFFVFFISAVPPMAITSFNKGSMHVAFLGYGVILGFAIFLWTLIAMKLNAWLSPKSDRSAGS